MRRYPFHFENCTPHSEMLDYDIHKANICTVLLPPPFFFQLIISELAWTHSVTGVVSHCEPCGAIEKEGEKVESSRVD